MKRNSFLKSLLGLPIAAKAMALSTETEGDRKMREFRNAPTHHEDRKKFPDQPAPENVKRQSMHESNHNDTNFMATATTQFLSQFSILTNSYMTYSINSY